MDKLEEEKEIKRILQFAQDTFDGKCKSIVDVMQQEKERVALEAIEWLEDYAIRYIEDFGITDWVSLRQDLARYLNERISATSIN